MGPAVIGSGVMPLFDALPLPVLGSASPTMLLSLAAVVLLGVGAQWIAWRLRVPSILLLLLFGFAAGPGLRLLGRPPLVDPDGLLGPVLLPLVGISVGLILYEGGLTLRLRDIRGVGRSVTMLVTVGALITCAVATPAARYLLGLPWSVATLLGAVLVVTGPTVIGPLLQFIRPAGKVGPILRWEGIVIDPIGALAAVLVLEAVLINSPGRAFGELSLAIFKTLVVGGGLGAGAAALLVACLSREWIPEHLQNPVSLMAAVGAYALSHALQPESGLLATTVMGVMLANQSRADIRHILEFKENLRTLLISVLFIALAARLPVEDLARANWGAAGLFLAVLVLVARPLGVWVSTLGQSLSVRERVFLALMAPRGIVAASVASVFALEVQRADGVSEAVRQAGGQLVPLTFSVIVGTVVVYGLLAPRAARWLGVSDADPQGLVVVGASRVSRAIAGVISGLGVRVLLIDTNRLNVAAARQAGLEAVAGDVLDDAVFESLDLRGVGRALAMTPNDEVNALAALRFERVLGRRNVYRVPARGSRRSAAGEAQDGAGSIDRAVHATDVGRPLFAADLDAAALTRRLDEGWTLRVTQLTPGFAYAAFRALYGPTATPLFVVDRAGRVVPVVAGQAIAPAAGDRVVALVDPEALLTGPAADAWAEADGAGPTPDEPPPTRVG